MRIRLFALLFALLILVGGGHRSIRRQTPPSLEAGPQEAQPSPKLVTARPIYPYSVVSGGVGSKDDIEQAIESDPVVAQHYLGINPRELKAIKLVKNTAAYVSFRMHGKVYWTSRKVKLSAGETVFQGNDIGVRGRCGNQISDQPRLPILPNPELEPGSEILSTPLPATVVAKTPGQTSRTDAPRILPLPLDTLKETAVLQPTPGNLGWSYPPGIMSGGAPGVVATGGGGGGGGGGSAPGGGTVSSSPLPTSPAGGTPVVSVPGSNVTAPVSSPPVIVVQPGSPVVISPPGQVAWPTAPPVTPPIDHQPNTPQPPGLPPRINPPSGPTPPTVPNAPPVTPAPPPDSHPTAPPIPPEAPPQGPVPPVNTPEPSSWGMLLAGTAVFGMKATKCAYARRSRGRLR